MGPDLPQWMRHGFIIVIPSQNDSSHVLSIVTTITSKPGFNTNPIPVSILPPKIS